MAVFPYWSITYIHRTEVQRQADKMTVTSIQKQLQLHTINLQEVKNCDRNFTFYMHVLYGQYKDGNSKQNLKV